MPHGCLLFVSWLFLMCWNERGRKPYTWGSSLAQESVEESAQRILTACTADMKPRVVNFKLDTICGIRLQQTLGCACFPQMKIFSKLVVAREYGSHLTATISTHLTVHVPWQLLTGRDKFHFCITEMWSALSSWLWPIECGRSKRGWALKPGPAEAWILPLFSWDPKTSTEGSQSSWVSIQHCMPGMQVRPFRTFQPNHLAATVSSREASRGAAQQPAEWWK